MKILDLYNSKKVDYVKKILKKNISLVGVFSKDCIHCNNMKPEWNILKNKLKKINNNNSLVSIDSNILNQLNLDSLTNSIQGLPTILVLKNGKKLKEYSGNRTSEDMFKFLKKFIYNNKSKKLKKVKKNNKLTIKRK